MADELKGKELKDKELEQVNGGYVWIEDVVVDVLMDTPSPVEDKTLQDLLIPAK